MKVQKRIIKEKQNRQAMKTSHVVGQGWGAGKAQWTTCLSNIRIWTQIPTPRLSVVPLKRSQTGIHVFSETYSSTQASPGSANLQPSFLTFHSLFPTATLLLKYLLPNLRLLQRTTLWDGFSFALKFIAFYSTTRLRLLTTTAVWFPRALMVFVVMENSQLLIF